VNNSYKEFRLRGQRVRRYLRTCLENGHELSRQLLNQYEFDEGEIMVYLPSETTRPGARDFTHGGLAKRGKSLDYLGRIIEQKIAIGRTICILENNLATPCDGYLAKAKSHLSFYDSAVYHFLWGPRDYEDVLTALQEADTDSNLIGAVCLSDGLQPPKGRDYLSKDYIIDICKQAYLVFAEVFDGEAFLLWNKPNVLRFFVTAEKPTRR
jgi:hypothetical protein